MIQDFHNDYPKFPINQEYLKTMIEGGVPENLAVHFSNLLVRDPLVVYDKLIYIEDKYDVTHFENFNSTNWNALRFKPPRKEDNDSCFKVEVRPCELQLTPFENASILGFVLLFNKILFTFDVNFIVPISQVDENFKRASLNDAITEQKFFWRVNSILDDYKIKEYNENKWLVDNAKIPESYYNKEENLSTIKELTIKEILLGCQEYNYPGILKLMYEYIDLRIAPEYKDTYIKYLRFIEKRVKGIIKNINIKVSYGQTQNILEILLKTMKIIKKILLYLKYNFYLINIEYCL